MPLGDVNRLLLTHLVRALPSEARIALCCAGKFLDWNWSELQQVLAGRPVAVMLDDSPRKLAAGQIHGVPVKPIAFASPDTVDAILITSDRMESRMVERLAPLVRSGIQVVRTARVERDPAVTPALIESVLNDPAPESERPPEPWEQAVQPNPLGAAVEITNGCNLNCLMCDTHSSTRPRGEMGLDLFRRALDELDAIGCRQFSCHTVGEPTIHHHF
jgi:hypothetical protein